MIGSCIQYHLLNSSQGRMSLRVAVGARQGIGGLVEFVGRDYRIIPTIETILVNDSLLDCHLIVYV